jgi:hypothetical protein
MVKNRAVAYVQECHEQTVTPEHLSTLAKRRFGAGGPPFAQGLPANVTLLRPDKRSKIQP